MGGGGVRGSEIQKSEKSHVNTHMHINLQRVVRQINLVPCEPGGNGGGGRRGLGGQKFKSQKKYMTEVLEMVVPAMWPP